MKQRNDTSYRDVSKIANSLDLDMSEAQAALIAHHLGRVLEVNQTCNLTRIVQQDEALRLHVADSLLGLPEVRESEGSIVDIGSGAGYPGIPLAVMTQRSTVLVESVGKKARFLSDVVDAMGLGCHVRVFSGRAEELPLDSPEEFGVCVSRALATLPAVIELSAPLLALGGRCVAYKGRISEDELEAGRAAASICGLEVVSIRETSLPEGGERRTLICLRKVAAPTLELPRRVGKAQARPLVTFKGTDAQL